MGKYSRLRRLAMIGAMTVMAGLASSAPVMALERSCHFVLEVTPQGDGLSNRIYSWRLFGEVERRSQANDLRRAIRRVGTECVQTHWSNRRASAPPPQCGETSSFNFTQYPFDAMYEQVREDICNDNRDEVRLTVDVELFIRGERGCLERDEERGVVDPAAYVVIAPNLRLNCPIRDAGGSEMGGAPASPPLPGTRLPGHDLRDGRVDGLTSWRDCWERCELRDGCGAWTFRPAGVWGEARSVCLLKSAAGEPVADSCCQSGINN